MGLFGRQSPKTPLGLGPAGWVPQVKEPAPVPRFQLRLGGNNAIDCTSGERRHPPECVADWAWGLKFTSRSAPGASLDVCFYVSKYNDFHQGPVYPVIVLSEYRSGNWCETFFEWERAKRKATYLEEGEGRAYHCAEMVIRGPVLECPPRWRFAQWNGRPVPCAPRLRNEGLTPAEYGPSGVSESEAARIKHLMMEHCRADGVQACELSVHSDGRVVVDRRRKIPQAQPTVIARWVRTDDGNIRVEILF